MIQVWHKANSQLEKGILAEFQSKLDARVGIQSQAFQSALALLRQLENVMGRYSNEVQILQKLNAACKKQASLVAALSKVLHEARPLIRLSTRGVRYSDTGGLTTKKSPPIRNQADILNAWQTDLGILTKVLREVIVDLRDAIPLAERGNFASMMLSGRRGFADKMPQFTDMFSAYERLYVRTVMATIAATMQVYPKGYEWLTAPRK